MSNRKKMPARFAPTGVNYSTEHGCWMLATTPWTDDYSRTFTEAFIQADDRPKGDKTPIARKAELEQAAARFTARSCPSTSAQIAEMMVREAKAGRLVDPDEYECPDCGSKNCVGGFAGGCGDTDDGVSDIVGEVTPEPETSSTGLVMQMAVHDLEDEVEALRVKVKDLEQRTPQTVQVKVPEREDVEIDGLVHKAFSKVLAYLVAGMKVYLHGPAGTGKTSLGTSVAQALGLPCHVASMHDMMDFGDMVGFLSPTTGEAVRSADAEALRRMFGEGGVYVEDEIDNGNANTIAGLNNLMLADEFHFPGDAEPTKRHPDFYLIAAANTYGTGPTAEYVGRNALDAASLNRFTMVEVDYDENIERTLASAYLDGERLDTFLAFCWQARKQLDGERIIFGTRNVVESAMLLAAGIGWDDVLTDRLLPGAGEDLVRKSGLSVAPAGF